MTLTIEVLAGMGNRLRAMVSAMCLAEDLHTTLRVLWPANNPACMAPFESLFDTQQLPSWVTVQMGHVVDPSVSVLSPSDLEMWLSSGGSHGDIKTISSYGHFYQKDPERWLRHLRSLRPLVSVDVPPNAVGVHIRRGDHQLSKSQSPLDAFISIMETYPETTPFIVATDSATEKKRLQERFGDRVIFHATSLSRMTVQGMKSALTDFIALSKCNVILGSYNSSFSELAAFYGGVQLQVVKITV